MTVFQFQCDVEQEWIDYNGHLRDAYYGLVFSLASDAFLESIGIDRDYRVETGATVYLLECHTFYLDEVKLGTRLTVDVRVIATEAKRFHVHMTMLADGRVRAVNERMELHVQQSPEPHAAPLPDDIRANLEALELDEAGLAVLERRSREMGFKR